MSKRVIVILIILVVVISGLLIFWKKPANAPTDNNTPENNQQPSNKYDNLPLERARERVLKKPFGIKISPQNSQVQPERFSGYHTGDDYEIFPGEENIDISIFAICNGKILRKEMANGYGGMLIQSCDLDNQPVTVVYGHIKLDSVSQKIGDIIAQGDLLAILGKGYSSETDNERKHLHLGIHKGAAVNSRGYVSTQEELTNWINYAE